MTMQQAGYYDIEYTNFFDKNHFHKNVEAEICPKL